MLLTTSLNSPRFYVSTIATSSWRGSVKVYFMSSVIRVAKASIANDTCGIRLAGSAVPGNVSAQEYISTGPSAARLLREQRGILLQQRHDGLCSQSRSRRRRIEGRSTTTFCSRVLQHHGVGPLLDDSRRTARESAKDAVRQDGKRRKHAEMGTIIALIALRIVVVAAAALVLQHGPQGRVGAVRVRQQRWVHRATRALEGNCNCSITSTGSRRETAAGHKGLSHNHGHAGTARHLLTILIVFVG